MPSSARHKVRASIKPGAVQPNLDALKGQTEGVPLMVRVSWLAASFFVALALSAACSGSSQMPTPTQIPTATPTLPTLSAAELNARYARNEIAANQQFRGKEVLLSGVVSRVGLFSAVALKDGVVCDFATRSLGQVLNLVEDQQVSIKGTVDGLNEASFVGLQVRLTGCTVLFDGNALDEEAFAAVSATALYEEHTADEEGASGKYRGEILEVNGVVAGIGELEWSDMDTYPFSVFRVPYVSLKTHGRWNVGCIFPDTRTNVVAGLVNNQLVNLKGRYSTRDQQDYAGIGHTMVLRDCAVVFSESGEFVPTFPLPEGQQTQIITVKRMQEGSGCSANDSGPVQTLDLEDEYLPVVVASENGAVGVSLEALKTQAVASRTFAIYKMQYEPRSASFDVCDTEADQVYNPSVVVRPEVQRAVEETSGIVVKWNGEVIAAFFVKGDEASGTARFLTVNEGRSGGDVTPTTLGSQTNPHNRGAMGQDKASELAAQGWDYARILRYFYGADLELSP